MKWKPPIIQLLRHQRIEAERVKGILIAKRFDTDVWCEELGFELHRVTSDVLIEPVVAMRRGKRIYVLRGLFKREEIEAIAHEYAHWKYHADCISFEELHEATAGRNEGQAIEFSRYVVEEL